MLWLCLHFPQLPLDIFTRGQSNQTRPMVISEKNQVYLRNRPALAQGIAPGQSLATASALADKLHIIERDAARENLALEQLADWSCSFTPMASMLDANSLVLEISGSLKLFKGLPALQEQITDTLKAMGYNCRQGVAHTPKAAQLLARYGRYPQTASPLNTYQYRRLLMSVPLSYLDTQAERIELLQNMGLTRVGEVLNLPASALAKRLGIDFLNDLHRLTGDQPDPQQPFIPSATFDRELFFIDGIENTEALQFPIKRLLKDFCDYLRTRQLHGRSLQWQLKSHHQPCGELNIDLSQAQNDFDNFLELTRIKLEALLLKAPIHTLTLTSENFSPAEAINGSLLTGEDANDKQSTPALLLDRLRSRLGMGAVQAIATADAHPPEQACRLVDYGALAHTASTRIPSTRSASNTVAQSAPRAQPKPRTRPLWLLNSPAPLKHEGRNLYWQGALTLLRGPERIQNQWWNKPITRDYFIARHEKGGTYWVFKEQKSKRWFVQGVFA